MRLLCFCSIALLLCCSGCNEDGSNEQAAEGEGEGEASLCESPLLTRLAEPTTECVAPDAPAAAACVMTGGPEDRPDFVELHVAADGEVVYSREGDSGSYVLRDGDTVIEGQFAGECLRYRAATVHATDGRRALVQRDLFDASAPERSCRLQLYDEAGQPTEELADADCDCAGEETLQRWTRTEDGRKLTREELDASGAVTDHETWTYDEEGRLVEHTRAATTETWSFDGEGRVVSHCEGSDYSETCQDTSYAEDGSSCTRIRDTEDITRIYDERCLVTRLERDADDDGEPNYWTEYEYDEAGRLVKRTQEYLGGSSAAVLEREYGAEGQLVQERYGTGEELYVARFTYDAAGRLVGEHVTNAPANAPDDPTLDCTWSFSYEGASCPAAPTDSDREDGRGYYCLRWGA